MSRTIDPGVAVLLERINEMPSMSEGSPAQARQAFRALATISASVSPPPAVERVEDLTLPGAEGGLPARLYLPAGVPSPVPTLLFLHGGGFVIGDIESYDAQCRTLCSAVAAAVLSIEYRLAPEHPFPAAPEDAVAAAAWVLANVDRLGGDPERIAIGGDSAGGNLAAVAAQAMRGRDPGFAAELLLYPATDFGDEDRPSHRENAEGLFLTADDMDWFRSLYIGDGSIDDPRLSPLRGELAGLPPTVLITADLDPLRDDGEAYGDALEAAGVEVVRRRYDGLVHGFFAMGPFSVGAQRAVEQICSDLRKLLGGGPVGA